ncbi:MAG TPA: hypothetical protein VGR28_08075 [Candidatus Thermoplasmatota archaeon]|nr:hypothetical protein [Candidatus Thermoplasmatota archaeon]
MQKILVALLAVGLAVLTAPVALAGVATPGTPVGEDCVLVDTDSCSTGGAVFTVGQYVMGVSGQFTGTITMTIAGGSAVRTQTCTGTLYGAVMFPGGCSSTGAFPPAGVSISMSCSASGSGLVACAVNGV